MNNQNKQGTTNFENVFLSKKNQIILRSAIIDIFNIKKIPIPNFLNLIIFNMCMLMLEKNISIHLFSHKKLSWINIEVLHKLIEEYEEKLEEKENFWEKTRLLKMDRLSKKEEDEEKEAEEEAANTSETLNTSETPEPIVEIPVPIPTTKQMFQKRKSLSSLFKF